jgi:hypothetical protein
MIKIPFRRALNCREFNSDIDDFPNPPPFYYGARLCGGSTSRLFDVKDYEIIEVVFSKTEPRDCKKYYELYDKGIQTLSQYCLYRKSLIGLRGYKGSFLFGIPEMLREAWNRGERYVTIRGLYK